MDIEIHWDRATSIYEIFDGASGMFLGEVRRGRAAGPRGGSVPVWNGWIAEGEQVVHDYPGSLRVAAGAVASASR